MEFRILGPLQAVSDGGVVEVAGVKPRALLALLLVHANVGGTCRSPARRSPRWQGHTDGGWPRLGVLRRTRYA
jgi:hypothetical protein